MVYVDFSGCWLISLKAGATILYVQAHVGQMSGGDFW
jgi:hypothetical protein